MSGVIKTDALFRERFLSMQELLSHIYNLRSRDSSVDMEAGYGLRSRSSSLGTFKNLLFSTSFRPALGPIPSPIQWVTEAHCLAVKRPEREADHSSPLVPRSIKHGSIYLLPHTSS
jgi:hypothetical protein